MRAFNNSDGQKTTKTTTKRRRRRWCWWWFSYIMLEHRAMDTQYHLPLCICSSSQCLVCAFSPAPSTPFNDFANVAKIQWTFNESSFSVSYLSSIEIGNWGERVSEWVRVREREKEIRCRTLARSNFQPNHPHPFRYIYLCLWGDVMYT